MKDHDVLDDVISACMQRPESIDNDLVVLLLQELRRLRRLNRLLTFEQTLHRRRIEAMSPNRAAGIAAPAEQHPEGSKPDQAGYENV